MAKWVDESGNPVTDPALLAQLEGAPTPSPGRTSPGPPPGLTSPHMTSWSGGPESAKQEVVGLGAGAATLGAGGLAANAMKKAAPHLPKIVPWFARLTAESAGNVGVNAAEKGLTEGRLVSPEESVLPAAAPALGRAAAGTVGGMLRAGRHLIPGHGIGEQAVIIDQMKDALGKTVKYGDYNTTYNRLKKLWEAGRVPDIPLPATSAASQNTSGELQLFVRSLRENGMNRLADALERITGNPSQPLNMVEANMGAIGKLTQSAKPDLSGGAKAAYTAIKSDLEQAAGKGNIQVKALLRAQKERGRKEVQTDIDKLVARATKPDNLDPRVAQFKPGVVTNPINQPTTRTEEELSKRFKKRLTPEEQEYFHSTIKPTYGRSSADVGEKDNPFQLKRRVPAMIISGALGGGAGLYGGGPLGFGLGVAGGVAAEEAIAQLMRREGGKELIKKMMLNKMGSGPLSGPLGAYLGRRTE